MNTLRKTNEVPVSLETLPAKNPQNDKRRGRPVSDLDPFTRGYRRLLPRLRAACAKYVEAQDVADLVQDVMLVATRSPARLAQGDTHTLSWLIGIAKRCAPSYESMEERRVPLDQLLAREAGDDLDGREIHEDVAEMRAEWQAR